MMRLDNTKDSVISYLQSSSDKVLLTAQTNHPLVLSTNNRERVRITEDGNVGIGTENPKSKLHIDGSITMSGIKGHMRRIYVDEGDLELMTDGGSIRARISMLSPDNRFAIHNSYGDVFTVQQNGNVGIGTTSPEAKLHIKDIGTIGKHIILENRDAPSGSNSMITKGSDGALVISSATWPAQPLRLYTHRNPGGEAMRIDSTGNICIGEITSPGAKLHIFDPTDSKLFISKNVAENRHLYLEYNTVPVIGVDAQESLHFSSGTKGDKWVTIHPEGNVGIGTMHPTDKLHVNGSIQVASGSGIRRYHTTATPGPYMLFDGGGGKTVVKATENFGTSGVAIVDWDNNGIFVQQGGNVGIGMSSTSYRLHINGTAYATGAAGAISDLRHKTNISDLTLDALNVINHLRPVTFEWKEPQDSGMEGPQLGFIAQEVEEVLPEAVLTQDNKEQTKGLKYSALIPVLTRAIQELKAQNEALKAENETMMQEIEQIKKAIGI